MKKNNDPKKVNYAKRHFFLILLPTFFAIERGVTQTPTNFDAVKNYVNVNIPKTPESAAFEKYRNVEVNEFTGAANISIPIYVLKSRFLECPITLCYQATGIKVNQEASWVGLGFDLIAGGRITVETRGCVDFSGSTVGLTSSNLQVGMTQIFNRLGNHGENAVMTPANFWDPPGPGGDPNLYNGFAMSEMTQYGTGEPDIFRANFLGHSLTFYVDKISNTINFLGEQSNFSINYSLDANHNITGWTIIDDDGITYYFNQAETTTNTLPGTAIIPATTTSSWLLTQILHPSGDNIQFTYTNFGYAIPAFTMSGSIDVPANGTATVASDQFQNVSIQSPFYLTRIEGADAAVDFILGTRTDLYGPGARKLVQIKVSDKITSAVKKTTSFNYSYFQSNFNPWAAYLNTLSYYLPSSLTTSGYLACSNSRLRLDSVSVNLSTYQPPYRFYYFNSVPDKYSYSQDHWGYYNAISNYSNGYSFSHLIPYSGLGGVGDFLPPPPGYGFSATSVGISRDCDPYNIQAMVLDSIVYPTGGSTAFTFEPHRSTMVPTVPVTGGGLRIQSIRNYAAGKISGTEYTYAVGKYMGTIHYFTTANVLSHCSGASQGVTGHWKYCSDGAINFNDVLIAYGQITITQKDANGQTNGFLVKTFDINTSSSNYANGTGFDLQPCYFVPGERTTDITGTWDYIRYLDVTHKNLPPTPSSNLEGKLIQEQYFDSSNNLLKSVNHYYHLANYTNSYYDIKAIQSRDGGFSGGCTAENGYGMGGIRPVNLFVSPAKSFHTLKDSVVEFTYSGSNSLKRKISYQYNSYYQPMFESIYNSDGTQTINYTRTSAEIYVPNGGGASGIFASQMYQMFTQHIRNLPIEQIVIHRGTAGDSSVVSSRFNVYKNSLPLQVYIIESQKPLAFRSQFVPWYYSLSSSYAVNIDNHYKLYSNADYSPNNMIWTLHALESDKAYIWDESYNTLLAQCDNTDSTNVAFTSFETSAKGRWTYSTPGVVSDTTAPTGNHAYNMATASISRGSLTSSTTYIVSYWTKSATSYTVSGSTSVKQGKTIKGWTFYEHTVTGVTTVIISGAGSIDEVRLYPSTAQMISYTYSPLFGITSQCDAGNRITYYFYDALGRLAWIKDQDKNIVKTFQYHFKGIPGMQY
jgi:hypothetical protein